MGSPLFDNVLKMGHVFPQSGYPLLVRNLVVASLRGIGGYTPKANTCRIDRVSFHDRYVMVLVKNMERMSKSLDSVDLRYWEELHIICICPLV